MNRIDLCSALVLIVLLPALLGSAPAARQGDPGSHAGSVIVQGTANVLINGLPAARIGHATTCPQMCAIPVPPFSLPHGPGAVLTGSTVVLIGGSPAARTGDSIQEPGILAYGSCMPIHAVATGSPNVLIGP